jgi:hypothetical protein
MAVDAQIMLPTRNRLSTVLPTPVAAIATSATLTMTTNARLHPTPLSCDQLGDLALIAEN